VGVIERKDRRVVVVVGRVRVKDGEMEDTIDSYGSEREKSEKTVVKSFKFQKSHTET
jgi:hypothetical protein